MRRRGFTLAELNATVAILGTMLLLVVPAFDRMVARIRLRNACQFLAHLLIDTRDRAVAFEQGTGIRFDNRGGVWTYAVYEDGDEDGVRNDDIRTGVDRRLRGPLPVLHKSSVVEVALPSGVTDPDTGILLPPWAAPVRFGSSSICAFSGRGDGTPGTIYVTIAGRTAMVRCAGDGGAIRIYYFNAGRKSWSS